MTVQTHQDGSPDLFVRRPLPLYNRYISLFYSEQNTKRNLIFFLKPAPVQAFFIVSVSPPGVPLPSCPMEWELKGQKVM